MEIELAPEIEASPSLVTDEITSRLAEPIIAPTAEEVTSEIETSAPSAMILEVGVIV